MHVSRSHNGLFRMVRGCRRLHYIGAAVPVRSAANDETRDPVFAALYYEFRAQLVR